MSAHQTDASDRDRHLAKVRVAGSQSSPFTSAAIRFPATTSRQEV